ncbi:hypothetical protein CMV_007402 [Castanea mollissima]|uniref:Uncharacterized protein n=1 Tax=Castanea mollissima TaxID=60419 RepID=A0A8J4RTR0_9ROSI|nr:hypothetical protein CMV_007402 [Castanea mollissima]
MIGSIQHFSASVTCTISALAAILGSGTNSVLISRGTLLAIDDARVAKESACRFCPRAIRSILIVSKLPTICFANSRSSSLNMMGCLLYLGFFPKGCSLALPSADTAINTPFTISVVKGLRIANQILVGLLGGSEAEDHGGSVCRAMGFWRWRPVSSYGFQAMKIAWRVWVCGDQLGEGCGFVEISVCGGHRRLCSRLRCGSLRLLGYRSDESMVGLWKSVAESGLFGFVGMDLAVVVLLDFRWWWWLLCCG